MIRNSIKRVTIGLILLMLGTGASGQTRYPAECAHSPITASVAQRLKVIAADGMSIGGFQNRFIKVGDSITVSPDAFMGQFIHPDHDPFIHYGWDYTRDLGDFEYLRSSMEHFLVSGLPGGETSFDRVSLAAQVGAAASWAIDGDPSPLQQEIDAVSPLFAVIMFGTNDIGWWTDDHLVISWIAGNLLEIVDECIAEGVIPILTAPPLRIDYEEKTHTLSHVVRALAQARGIPFINYHRSMMPLTDHGLSGDGVHPNSMAYNRNCHLTAEGLLYGTNTRNLVTLQALDRALRAAVLGAPALDFEPAGLIGDGSSAAPFDVDTLPFIDTRATTPGTLSQRYVFTLDQTTQTRLMVVYQGTTDADLRLFDSSLGLIASDDGLIDIELAAGQYFLDVEANNDLIANAGEYQLLIMDRTTTGTPNSHGIFLDGANATPSEIAHGQPATITFKATALDTDGTITGVFLDLGELGGSASTAMTSTGNGGFTHTEVFPSPDPGEKTVTVTATDNEGHQTSVPVFVLVGSPIFKDDFESGSADSWSAVTR